MSEEEASFFRRDRRREYSRALKPQKEGTESEELFKGTLGFDFIFLRGSDGTKQIKCVEINGEHSGITGIQDIPRTSETYLHKLLARSRNRTSEEFDELAGRDLDLKLPTPTPEERLHRGRELIDKFMGALDVAEAKRMKELQEVKMHAYSHANPPFVEEIMRDKSKQGAYIPRELAPKLAHMLSDISPGSEWVVKPKEGMKGEGIYVMDAEQIQHVIAKMENDGVDPAELFTENVVQEFIEPLPADNAPAHLSDHVASLRLLVDFRYMNNGEIEPAYITGYQRVSPYSREGRHHRDGPRPANDPESFGDTSEPYGIAFTEDIYVVNKARGALSVPLSKEESTMAIEAAKEIIRNLGEAYRKDSGMNL